jgi:hypothetical protein
MKVLMLLAAYGRSYQTAKEAIDDWYAGKDFQIIDGPYCSIRDSQRMLQEQLSHVQIVDAETIETLAVIFLGTLTDD